MLVSSLNLGAIRTGGEGDHRARRAGRFTTVLAVMLASLLAVLLAVMLTTMLTVVLAALLPVLPLEMVVGAVLAPAAAVIEAVLAIVLDAVIGMMIETVIMHASDGRAVPNTTGATIASRIAPRVPCPRRRSSRARLPGLWIATNIGLDLWLGSDESSS